jgi:hypothetical protein
MKKYSHEFIETFDGFPGFGWDRQTDEDSVICHLQMFSDDQLMKHLVPKLGEEELAEIYFLINRLLRKYLKDAEYHRLFLKEDHP